MLDIKPLRYFVKLAETLHFGRAAAQLHLSQPPLSRQLAALEESLGVKLLERNARSVALTPAGERFYVDARAILAALAQATENARIAAAGTAGKLSVGFTMCAAYSVVPRYARTFNAAYPNVELHLREIVSNDLAEQVLSGQMDAGIVFPNTFDKTLKSRTVVREPLSVVLSRDHPLAKRRHLRCAQLAGEPFVLAAENVAPTLRAAIVNLCRASGFKPDIRFEVQLQQTILSFVAEGAGVALVPTSMRKVKMDGVVFRPLVDSPMIEQMLIWSRTNRNPCLERFLEATRTMSVA